MDMKWVQHRVRVLHWNGYEMGSTYGKGTAME
jgi:hypothetical protein